VGDANGYYESAFVVSSNGMVNKEGFAMWIDYNPKQSNNGAGFSGMAGLFGLGMGNLGINFGGLLGTLFLAILLIVLVAVIILGIARITKPKRREAWQVREQ
jgi:predicted lipid-binding transport protein (Tim44 family)